MSWLYRIEELTYRYQMRTVLRIAALEFEAGRLVSVVGPNGAGKSTLVAAMAGLKSDYEGSCRVDGREVREWPRRELARAVTFLPQQVDLAFPFTAEEVVMMGRTPHAAGLFDSPRDLAAVRNAMELTDTLAFQGRDFRTLSGGEKQRVVLAAALAQEPRVLLLDEPTTFLDLQHQVAVYELLARLARGGLLVVAVSHDLNLALHYADRAIVLVSGEIRADGVPQEALRRQMVKEVFGADVPWIQYGQRSPV